MNKISEVQRKIAILLNAESKTVEELNSQLELGFDVLTKELNNLIKLGLVKKTSDFPTKYCLDDYIQNELKKRKEVAATDSYRLKIQMILDIEGISKEIVELQLNKLKNMVESEKDITIYSITLSDIIEQDNTYFGYLDINFTVKDLRSLVHLVMYYNPSSIEVVSPHRYDISLYELQDSLIELSQRSSMYSRELQKRLTKEESDLLLKRLFK